MALFYIKFKLKNRSHQFLEQFLKYQKGLKSKIRINILNNETNTIMPQQEAAKQLDEYLKKKKSETI